MRLLTKKDVRKTLAGQLEAESLQAARVHELLTSETKALNEWRAQKEAEVEKIRAAVAEAEKEYSQKIEELKNEVASLENRQKEARKPLTELANSLKAKEVALELAKKEVIESARSLEGERSALVQLKASLVDKETDILDRYEVLERKEQACEKQAAYISESHKAFNSALAEWSVKKAREELALEDEKAAVLTEKNIIKAEKEFIENSRKDLEKERLRIVSDRATLKLAFDEGRKKGFL